MERLAAARLLTVSDDYVEVAHEALFREWPRLRGWLEDDRAGREAERRLAVAAEEWRAEGEDPALLWRGARLEAGLELAAARPEETTSVERAFLEAGRAAAEEARLAAERRAEREARQNRRLRAILAGQPRTARGRRAWQRPSPCGRANARPRRRPTSAAVGDRGRRQAAGRVGASVEQADLALLTAVEATRDEQSPETYGAVLTLLARQPDVVTRIRTPNRFFSVATDRRGHNGLPRRERSGAARRGPGHRRGALAPRRPRRHARRSRGLSGRPDRGGRAPGRGGRPARAARRRHRRHRAGHVTLAEVNRTTGGTAPYLWAGRGLHRRGAAPGRHRRRRRTRLARGRLLGSVPWPRQVFDDGSFLVWPDGQVSVGGTDAAGDTTATLRSCLDTERPGAAPREVAGVVRAVDRRAHRVVVTRPTPSGAELLLLDARTFEPESNAWPADPETERRAVLRGRRPAAGRRRRAGRAPRRRHRRADPRAGRPQRRGGGRRVRRVPATTCCGRPGATAPRWRFDLTGRRGVFATTRTRDTPWAGEGAARADTVVWTDRIETDVNHVYLLRRGRGTRKAPGCRPGVLPLRRDVLAT